MYYLYILQCSNNKLYIGVTDNLDRRFYEHRKKSNSHFTGNYTPEKILYNEEYPAQSEALKRERQIKGWSRAKKDALINGNVEKLKSLSKSEKEPLIQGFSPLAGNNPEILILGSMPGEESIRLQQYYAHKNNAFWKIMGKLFHFDNQLDYDSKILHLINNKIALWDVLKTCKRKGSLDSAIKDKTIEINDFNSFFSKHKSIKYIFFNGTKAYHEFKKRVQPTLKAKTIKEYISLPSTSPAMASLSFQEKILKWEMIKIKLEPLSIKTHYL